jgi:osmotically-inducible protein OsmY
MDTRQRNARLELTVLRALSKHNRQALLHVMVKATDDGTVYLKGVAASPADCALLTRIASQVPGVSQVFCNVAANERRETCHA